MEIKAGEEKMKILFDSFLLTFQFFTAVPVHKELQLTKKTVTGMLVLLPWTGAVGGVVAALIAFSLQSFFDVSSLLMAFLVILWMAIFTGGLHYDGLIDTGDAFFSYRDIDKRLEILGDPRVGAFGVMTFIFLLLGKCIVIQELLSVESPPFWAMVLLPLLARVGMGLFFVSTTSSKESGLGFFFKERTNGKVLVLLSICTLVVAIIFVGLLYGEWLAILALVISLLIIVWLYRRFALKNFRGLSGDLLGAFIEGTEFALWIILLLFIS